LEALLLYLSLELHYFSEQAVVPLPLVVQLLVLVVVLVVVLVEVLVEVKFIIRCNQL
jgi:hypothetical protein